ncbi:MAG: DNA polymerase/3'-5' exonuclease PolX [Candidatus Aenigmarchaeota archaeon]|nr:DNA polymerase/3'-5' exonuclease PolX [Candidatus Aenigmarchaeota archaeon]
MKNAEIAKILYEIADILEMQAVEFKPRAYRRAAQSIETLQRDITEIWHEEKLRTIPGVGEAIEEKISEYLETGRLPYYEKLKKSLPVDLQSLMAVESLGPKRIGVLYRKLGIKNLDDLEKAAKEHCIEKLDGFGEKSEKKILDGIEFAKGFKGRMLLGTAFPIANEIVDRLRKLDFVNRAEFAGSLRRMKETIGDIDILVTSKDHDKVIDFFTKMEDVGEVIARGPTKASVRLKAGVQVDIRVLEDNVFGAALQYFTGSKEHNVVMRKIAISRGLKLSEYGLFKGNKLVAGRTEEDVYNNLGLDFVEPEMRENTGETDAAKNHALPDLVKYGSIKGDLQMHTKWSDGANATEEIADAAEKLSYEYICITDHGGNLKVAGSLDESEFRKQWKEIDEVNEKMGGIRILKGVEANIGPDGKIDMPDKFLKEFDIVVASIHSSFGLTKEQTTKRLIEAMENENVDIIGHPTARNIEERKGVDMDFEKVFGAAKRTGTLLEINAQPNRLDLNDANARYAIKTGCKLVISTDAHSTEQLANMRFGVGVARRAWAESKSIVNTLPLKDFMKCLKK